MNRFKFRAWDIQRKKYLYDVQDTYDNMLGDDIVPHISFAEFLYDNNYIVEQCTGMKDKNGNLIYEGDICNIQLNSGTENALVVWDGGSWKFQRGSWVKPIEIWESSELEIIGNVHTKDKE